MELPEVDGTVHGDGWHEQGECDGTDPGTGSMAAGMEDQMQRLIDYMRDEVDVTVTSTPHRRAFSSLLSLQQSSFSCHSILKKILCSIFDRKKDLP